MNILFIVGSMREHSFNLQLAEKAKELIGDKAQVNFLNYKNIPFMNQDLEKDLPDSVKEIKEEVQKADAIWIFTPEYNGMIPGVLKNLLDWLSRSYIPGDFSSGTPVKGKPVTVSGVGGGNATKGVREQLDVLLKRIGMNVMIDQNSGYSVLPAEMKSDSWTITPEDEEKLKEQVNEFLNFIS